MVAVKGWRGIVAGWLLEVATRLDLADMVALLLKKSIREWGNPEASTRVLCVQRSIFEDDVYAMAQSTASICFGMLPKGKLYTVFRVFIAKNPDWKVLTEFNYHHGCCREELEAYGRFMERVFESLTKRWPFDAMLSGNFGYKEQQELMRIVESKGIPFIVLFKEGLVIPAYLNELPAKVIDGKRFLGSKLIFYSEQIRDAVLKSNAFEGAEFETAVSGIPRVDSMVDVPILNQKRIVFFSFFPEDKFRCFESSPETLKNAIQAADQFHRSVVRFAADHPQYDLLIKTKVAPRYVDYVRGLLEDELGGIPSNIEVTNEGAAAKMILDSAVVIAFQSTTAIEALVAEREVICPDFAEYFGDEPWDYFHEFPELVTYAKTTEDLGEAVLREGVSREESWRLQRETFLKRMVHGSDGLASERAVQEILASIEKRKAGHMDSNLKRANY